MIFLLLEDAGVDSFELESLLIDDVSDSEYTELSKSLMRVSVSPSIIYKL